MGQSYRELIAWQKAMDFVMDVYAATKLFPRDETYGLASQLRSTAVLTPPTSRKVKHVTRHRNSTSS